MNQLLFIVLQAASPMGSNGSMQLLMLLAIIAVFYFFMIRPQMKKQKDARKFRDSLKVGDKVITLGGVYGKIAEISEQTIQLEIGIGSSVKIKVDKNALVKDPSDISQ